MLDGKKYLVGFIKEGSSDISDILWLNRIIDILSCGGYPRFCSQALTMDGIMWLELDSTDY